MKKLAFLLAALLLIATLGACGDKNEKTSGSTTNTGTSQTTSGSSGNSANEYDFSKPVPRVTGDWAKKAYFDDAVFVGDSVTTGLHLYSFFENATVLAERGIDPANFDSKQIVSAKKTIPQALKEKQFGKVYIMLGANAAVYTDTDAFIAAYTKMLGEIRTLQPKAAIYIQAAFPITQTLSDKNKASNNGLTNERLTDYNAALQKLAANEKVYFVNTHEALADANGYLPAAYSDDGVHIKAAQYQLWYDYLRSHVAA